MQKLCLKHSKRKSKTIVFWNHLVYLVHSLLSRGWPFGITFPPKIVCRIGDYQIETLIKNCTFYENLDESNGQLFFA